jgi:hypothetical protein
LSELQVIKETVEELIPAIVFLHQLGLLAENVVSEIDEIVGRSDLLLLEILDCIPYFLDELLHLGNHIRNHLIG